MKNVMCAILGTVVLFSGCASSIKTTFTKYNDSGKPTASGTTQVTGWSDKIFESAAEGFFVDMAPGSEGAGLKAAKTKVEGSGFADTFKGLGDMMGGMAMLIAQVQGLNLGGGGGNNSNVNNSNNTGNSNGTGVSGTPPQLALPEGDAVWLMGGPSCSRCAALRRSLGATAEIGGLPIRWSVYGQSAHFDALRRIARDGCADSILFPFVIVMRGGEPLCVGRLVTLTADGLAEAVRNVSQNI
jgi:hypothetical protein